jgi:3-methyladenine DNA glycosylase AlkD
MGLLEIRKTVKEMTNPELAQFLQRFFKTGKGEYAYGDKFAGIKVPASRIIAKNNVNISLTDLNKLIRSEIHEERLIVLLILVEKFKRANEIDKEKIYKFYLKNKKFINNWDLVDLSAHHIVGGFLFDKKKDILFRLAASPNIWDRRIAVISTFYFIKNNEFKPTIELAALLLEDTHDLIHKAVGWMLREMGKKNEKILQNFLQKNYKEMPRTMLRYAIEKFPEKRRQAYLKGTI